MPKRLVGILVCILLANILNFALGRWLTEKTAEWAPTVAVADGSTLNTSRYFQERADTTLAGSPDAEALLDFYNWLDRGGSEAYLTWEASRRDLRAASTPFLERALTVAESSNAGRYLSLLLLIVTILLLWGKGLGQRIRIQRRQFDFPHVYGRYSGLVDSLLRWVTAVFTHLARGMVPAHAPIPYPLHFSAGNNVSPWPGTG